ncbi:putative ribonuclease H-like domain-containing protein [Tanacetum coccineum]
MLPELLKQMVFVAERRNGTLIEVAKTMLADSKLPTIFWAKAVSTACYVQNRVLVVKPHNKTPYELFRGFKSALSFMRPFGCHVTIFNTLENLGKFDDKSDEGFFVGYSFSSKDFRVYNTRTRRVEENLHIGYNSQLVGVEYARTQEELNAGTSNQKEEITQDCIVMPIWKDAIYFDSPSKDVGNGEPKSADDDQKQVEDGPHNESDEKVNTASSYELDSPKDMFKLGASHTLETTHEELLQFKLQQVWKLVDLPNGMGPLEQKWFMLLNQGFKDPAFQTKFSRCMVKALYGLLKDQELYETLLFRKSFSPKMGDADDVEYLVTKGFDAGRHVKRGRDTKIPQSSSPPIKVGDKAVHKELGDRMERAATTASSLEVVVPGAKIPYWGGGVDAQTRFETTSK